jgi:hypothetical protein
VVAAGSHRSVTDATVEVLTTENALVATLTPDSAGRVTQELLDRIPDETENFERSSRQCSTKRNSDSNFNKLVNSVGVTAGTEADGACRTHSVGEFGQSLVNKVRLRCGQ